MPPGKIGLAGSHWQLVGVLSSFLVEENHREHARMGRRGYSFPRDLQLARFVSLHNRQFHGSEKEGEGGEEGASLGSFRFVSGREMIEAYIICGKRKYEATADVC